MSPIKKSNIPTFAQNSILNLIICLCIKLKYYKIKYCNIQGPLYYQLYLSQQIIVILSLFSFLLKFRRKYKHFNKLYISSKLFEMQTKGSETQFSSMPTIIYHCIVIKNFLSYSILLYSIVMITQWGNIFIKSSLGQYVR